jgi:hypothetical protein
MKVLVVLLSVLVLEGAVMIGMYHFDQDDDIDDTGGTYDEDLKDMIDALNTRGGKIYFNNGNTNELKPGTSHVSLKGGMIHIDAHDGYKETYAPISAISSVSIY